MTSTKDRFFMIEFDETITRLKQVLAHKADKEKILDKEVAASLRLSPQYFAVIKRRKKIPYEALAHFCKQHKVNLNWLLLAQDPPYLT
jgi:hypothetical protein